MVDHVVPPDNVHCTWTKVVIENPLCLKDRIHRDSNTDKVFPQETLKTEEDHLFKHPTPTLEVGVDVRRSLWVLVLVGDLVGVGL